MQRILRFVTRLTRLYLRSLHNRFVAWTKTDTTTLMLGMLTDLTRSKSELVAENAFLRQQLIILRRQVKRPACTKTDRMLLVLLARAIQAWKQALLFVQEDDATPVASPGISTLLEVQIKGLSQPKIAAETIALIKEMARENRLWGAERIRGELLKLGIRVCKRTISEVHV